ncbi:hypothetical protein DSO57_1004400 [Entomophthora muscae]|uniref:Uncharacterized protein n=1 Tax=Entomophthora muscae TaxID=34485 RepID=A0ACC2SX47_9FUNG|nr:hypothetical protein DSO57_1004400 [Entomophthora muscae]
MQVVSLFSLLAAASADSNSNFDSPKELQTLPSNDANSFSILSANTTDTTSLVSTDAINNSTFVELTDSLSVLSVNTTDITTPVSTDAINNSTFVELSDSLPVLSANTTDTATLVSTDGISNSTLIDAADTFSAISTNTTDTTTLMSPGDINENTFNNVTDLTNSMNTTAATLISPAGMNISEMANSQLTNATKETMVSFSINKSRITESTFTIANDFPTISTNFVQATKVLTTPTANTHKVKHHTVAAEHPPADSPFSFDSIASGIQHFFHW